MTNGREKSDSAIVAARPTNKAERSGSEPAEPRAGAEGNALQQSASRTQGRADASQALERIRQAARQRRKEKFTALFHHLTIDRLEDAFNELKEDAAAGADGLTWTEYEAALGRNLGDGTVRAIRAKCEIFTIRPVSQMLPVSTGSTADGPEATGREGLIERFEADAAAPESARSPSCRGCRERDVARKLSRPRVGGNGMIARAVLADLPISVY